MYNKNEVKMDTVGFDGAGLVDSKDYKLMRESKLVKWYECIYNHNHEEFDWEGNILGSDRILYIFQINDEHLVKYDGKKYWMDLSYKDDLVGMFTTLEEAMTYGDTYAIKVLAGLINEDY